MEQPINYVAHPGTIGMTKRPVPPEKMVQVVREAHADVYGIDPVDMETLQSKRRGPISDVRHLCYAFLRTASKLGTAQAGAIFNRDHATVLHGHRRACELSQVDVRFRNIYHRVASRLAGDGYFVEPPHYVMCDYMTEHATRTTREEFKVDARMVKRGMTVGQAAKKYA